MTITSAPCASRSRRPISFIRRHRGARVGELGDAKADREVGGEAVAHAHRARYSADGAAPTSVRIEITPKRWPRVSAVRMPHSAMPSTGFAVASRAGMEAGIAEAGDDESGSRIVLRGDGAAQRLDHQVGVLLAFDPGRAFMQSLADDPRAAGEAQRRHRRIDRRGHRLGRIGVDDDNWTIRRDLTSLETVVRQIRQGQFNSLQLRLLRLKSSSRAALDAVALAYMRLFQQILALRLGFGRNAGMDAGLIQAGADDW